MSDRAGYLEAIEKLPPEDQWLAYHELAVYGGTFVMDMGDGTAKHIPVNKVYAAEEMEFNGLENNQ